MELTLGSPPLVCAAPGELPLVPVSELLVEGDTVVGFALESSAVVATGSLLSVSSLGEALVPERVRSGLAAVAASVVAALVVEPVGCAAGAAGAVAVELESVSAVEPSLASAKRVSALERSELDGSLADEPLPEAAVEPLPAAPASLWLEGCVACVAVSVVAAAVGELPASFEAGGELAGDEELSVSTSAGLVAGRLAAETAAWPPVALAALPDAPSLAELELESLVPEEKSLSSVVELG